MGEEWPLGGRIGVVGGGQLGRMLGEAATPLGVELVVLDPTPAAPASPVAREQVVAAFDDADAVRRLAEQCDVLTYEIELADPDLLADVAAATDTPVHPAPDSLRTIQDKLVQKRSLRDAGIPVPAFAPVDSLKELRAACDQLGYPAMLKARTGGYDGRGNVPIEGPRDVETAFANIDAPAMVEEHVEFVRELSVIGVRGRTERTAYVVGENIHKEEILRETVVPARAPADVRAAARDVAGAVIDEMAGRGVFGIELFETPDGEILVNEIAPRPHNSGHWTIEGAVTSQFEQHVRAVCGGPLGPTSTRGPIVTANLLGDVDAAQPVTVQGIDELLAAPEVDLHWYGKREVRPLRKMGHIAVTTPEVTDRDDLLHRARRHVANVTFRG